MSDRNHCPRPSRLPSVGHLRGLSLIELMCTVSVLTTLLGIALPSLHDWRDRQALHAAAAELETDIQYARTTSAALSRTIRLRTQALGGSSCYLLHTGDPHACACSGEGQAACSGNGRVLRLVEHATDSGVRLSTTNVSIAFDPERGTVTPTATLKLVDKQERAIHQVVNIMGRVRTCSPQGTSLGLKSC